ncbi:MULTISPECIES: TetR/AcrR family transcriptional regulator [Aliivibrio]|jgi:TetR/AcrR family transcriptional repressor of multidrug resistance operon|nr:MULTISPECIES: TetR/AcrR family transcriptional regulator [Aliivibrio]MBB1313292.1 TetR/AcrR family transcriptional regulator [Aliivibrio sp. SR45-2]
MKEKRRLILESAEQLLATDGFRGLSMQKVANQAGVAAGTIYRYFDDKEALIQEIKLNILQRVACAIQENVCNTDPLKVRFRTMWLNIWYFAISEKNTFLNRNQYESLPTTDLVKFRELEKEMFAQVNQLFVDGLEQGIFKPFNVEILTGLSLETSVCLARRYAQGAFTLTDDDLDSAIEASWDAIIKH